MPEAASAGTIADADRLGALARPASQIHDHQIRADATGTLAQALALSVDASAQGGLLQVDVTLSNQALGHAFPTGIAIRNALLMVRARRNGSALALQAGPVLPWWADDDVPGQQQGDLAGQPGLGFAKVLEGRIAGQGSVVRPVLFVDAEAVSEDSVFTGWTIDGAFAGWANPLTLTLGAEASLTQTLNFQPTRPRRRS